VEVIQLTASSDSTGLEASLFRAGRPIKKLDIGDNAHNVAGNSRCSKVPSGLIRRMLKIAKRSLFVRYLPESCYRRTEGLAEYESQMKRADASCCKSLMRKHLTAQFAAWKSKMKIVASRSRRKPHVDEKGKEKDTKYLLIQMKDLGRALLWSVGGITTAFQNGVRYSR